MRQIVRRPCWLAAGLPQLLATDSGSPMIPDQLQELIDHTLAQLQAADCEMTSKGAERWRGLCPLCGKRDLTLNVDLDQDRLWLNCSHATCDWRAIQEAVGLTRTDLQLDQVTGGELVRRPLNTIKIEPVEHLVPERVPIGGTTMVVGDPFTGKTTWTALVSAEATRGNYGEPATVGFINAEDSVAAVTRPRLQAAGADLSRVVALTVNADDCERPLTLPDDVPLLETFVQETGARLLVLDPLMAFLAERVDSNRDHGVRRALAGLAMMAERHKVAVLICAHLNKDEQKRMIYRVGGTIGLVGLARSVLLFARDPSDPDAGYGDQRLLAHAGSNWARLAPTQRYHLEEVTFEEEGEPITTTKLVLDGESDIEAAELVGKQSAPTKTERAAEAILAKLDDGQQHPPSDVKTAVMEVVRCRRDTVERAAADLRARGVLRSSGNGPATTWHLLDQSPDPELPESGGYSDFGSRKPNKQPEKQPPDQEIRESGDSDQAVWNGSDGDDRARVEEELARRERRG
jgi:hypothetical protein